MIIRVGMAPRRTGLSISEFQRHWRGPHADAALRIPNLRGYVQNHAVLNSDGRPLLPYPGFDACAETVFDDLAGMDEGFASATYQQDVRADERELIDGSGFAVLLCERSELDTRPAPTDAVKLMTFWRLHPSCSREELVALAAGPYAEEAGRAGALRHEQLVPSIEAHVGRQPMACDLVDCLWFATAAQALDFVNGPRAAQAEQVLAGKVFGRERLLGVVEVIRPLPAPVNSQPPRV